ncbi:HR1-domain-containing protein, partial [Ascobolus immersus RN42]
TMSDRVLQDVSRKIERQKQFIASARSMRQATDNPAMQSRVDNEIRNLQKNLMYLEDTMRELQLNNGPSSGSQSSQHGSGTYSQMQPPNAPFAQQANHGPKSRPNYTKLDLIKYDTPHLGPRIQLMLSQLQFKLSVEKQYKEGIEKMASLYRMDGDRKSKADAEAKRVESNQKIQLLKQALKRYEDLHVDFETDDQDDDSINAPNIRRPLTGKLMIRVIAVKDVDHASTSRFARGPETSVVIKVEDQLRVRTKITRNDKWVDEAHDLDVDKANEIEIIVSDKPGDHMLPIGLLWIRLSDIAEEMRRKKIEQEIAGSGWVRAENMGNQEGPTSPTNFAFPGPPPNSGAGMFANASGGRTVAQADPHHGGPGNDQVAIIDAWFALEPVGQIRLQLSFVKFNRKPRLDLGLGRQGAVRQRKEEIHEKYGHKFVQQQFYNIMRCALCGDFLKYSAGYQCTDCKYTCHKKCYQKVVTKCISKSNAETDPEEEKINHRIPHRFESTTNIGANWCCHCGYMLPIGKKNARKCTECALTCHAQCAHLVPDFCGMSMEVANQILSEMRRAPRQQQRMSGAGSRQSGSSQQRPTSQQPSTSYGSQSEAGSHLSYPPASPVSAQAADKAYRQPAPYTPS